jgi:hypothetical protein
VSVPQCGRHLLAQLYWRYVFGFTARKIDSHMRRTCAAAPGKMCMNPAHIRVRCTGRMLLDVLRAVERATMHVAPPDVFDFPDLPVGLIETIYGAAKARDRVAPPPGLRNGASGGTGKAGAGVREEDLWANKADGRPCLVFDEADLPRRMEDAIAPPVVDFFCLRAPPNSFLDLPS